jgi:hypothetical protein
MHLGRPLKNYGPGIFAGAVDQEWDARSIQASLRESLHKFCDLDLIDSSYGLVVGCYESADVFVSGWV